MLRFQIYIIGKSVTKVIESSMYALGKVVRSEEEFSVYLLKSGRD